MECFTTVLIQAVPSDGLSIACRSLLGTTILDASACLLTAEEAEDIRWYHNDHALLDPFSIDRAGCALQSLVNQACALARCLQAEIQRIYDAAPGLQILEFLIDTSFDGMKIHWEWLEREEAWTSCPPVTIRVSHNVGLETMANHESGSSRTGPINILFVSARPAYKKDVPYRLISKPLWKMINSTPELKSRVKIVFLRPATWVALKKMLSDSNAGYFHIVHFDVHGGWEKSRRSAESKTRALLNGLYFTSRNSSRQRPDFRSAQEIATLLKQHGVSQVILNACDTGGTHVIQGQRGPNLASVLCSHGLDNVIAMSYALLADTANAVMRTLYEELLLCHNTMTGAAACARRDVRQHVTKKARFGLTAEVDDFGVMVLYQGISTEDLSGRMKVQTRHRPRVASDSAVNFFSETLQEDEDDIQGRDGDLLALEAAFTDVKCVNLIAPGGSGKTAMAKYAIKWWHTSGFVDETMYFDLTIDHDLFGGDGGIYFHMQPETDVQQTFASIHSSRVLICIDNYEARILRHLPEHHRHNLYHFLSHANEESSKCLVLLVSSNTLEFDETKMARIVDLAPLDMQDAVQIAQRLMVNIGENHHQKGGDPVHLECLLEQHNRNMLFCQTFLPSVVDLASVRKLLHDLEMGLPEDNSGLPLDVMAQCESETISSFHQALGRIRSRSQLALFTFLSLAPFTTTHSVMLCYHVFKFRERDLVVGDDVTFANMDKLPVLQPDEFRCSTWEELQRLVPEDPLSQEYDFVKTVLYEHGLVVKKRQPHLSVEWPESLGVEVLHPMLSYLIRNELRRFEQMRPDLASIASVVHLCDTMFWETFESRACAIIQAEGVTPDMIDTILDNEWSNFRKAAELSLHQPQYGQRSMGAIALIEMLATPRLLRFRNRRMTLLDLADNILGHYDKFRISNPELAARPYMVMNTLSVFQAKMNCQALFGDENGVISTLKGAQDLIRALPASFVDESHLVEETRIYFDVLSVLKRLTVWSQRPIVHDLTTLLFKARNVKIDSPISAKINATLILCLCAIAADRDFRNLFIRECGRALLRVETEHLFDTLVNIQASNTFQRVDFSYLASANSAQEKLLRLAWTLQSPEDEREFQDARRQYQDTSWRLLYVDQATQIDPSRPAAGLISMIEIGKELELVESLTGVGNLKGQILEMQEIFKESIRSRKLGTALLQDRYIRELEMSSRTEGDGSTSFISIAAERGVNIAMLMLEQDYAEHGNSIPLSPEKVPQKRRAVLLEAKSLLLDAVATAEEMPGPLNFSNYYARTQGTLKLSDVSGRLGDIVMHSLFHAKYKWLRLTREMPDDARPGVWGDDSDRVNGGLMYNLMRTLRVDTFLGSSTLGYHQCEAYMGPGADEIEDLSAVDFPLTEDIAPGLCFMFPWWTPRTLAQFFGQVSMLQYVNNDWTAPSDFDDLPKLAKTILSEAECVLVLPPDDERLASLTMWSNTIDEEGSYQGTWMPRDEGFWEENEVKDNPVYSIMGKDAAWQVYEIFRLERMSGCRKHSAHKSE